ncbi:oligosaccharide flippase family protein [Poritiphilus flavus]|uniref:Oligosaccharide flippase family protein n=1 Tax=Poritiphilus flavus TaxID=2697053 RepID=A0A6L9E8J2_9FLAO|nr:oligosaccharide flippase family protein [Poritiphilus flavus]NAS10974.1 oligosaccharide flippase family protein [Poritiphilus flavus]
MKWSIKNLLQSEQSQNLILRVFTVVAKFLLSILIVKKLGIYEMGVFGIFQTTVTLLIYLLGFDFYTYNTREILKQQARGLNYYLVNQLFFHGLIYLLVLPAVIFVFLYNVVDFQYIWFFYGILVAEHLSQELYRILIVLKRSVIASAVLFVRSGLWILLLLLLWTFSDFGRTINSVLILWLIGAVISIFMALRYVPFKLNLKEIDTKWIRKGVMISTPFFISTIFYKIMEFSGRYFLDYFSTKEAVGIFTFFYGISNALFVFVHATVIIVMSPHIIESAGQGIKSFNTVFGRFRKQVLVNTVVGFLIGAASIYPFLYFFDSPELSENSFVFFVLLMATFFFCCSYIPHYKLYAFKQDHKLLQASVLGAVINLGSNFLLVPKYGVMGAAFAQMLGMLALFLIKQFLFQRSRHE